jgi:3-phytase
MRIPVLLLAVPLAGCVDPTSATDDTLGSSAAAVLASDTLHVPPFAATPPLPNYKNAPRTADVDDAAIWRPQSCGARPFVIGTLKNGGLQVYDLDGHVLQTVSPANRPAILAEDPPAAGVQPEAGTGACPESASGATFGRYNNVDIVYGFPLRQGYRTRRVDVAVVSDRGCDRLHFFAIDAARAGGPLVDITATQAARIFPERRVRPSPVQSPGASERVEANPLDDQNTAYGLAVFGEGSHVRAVVTQEKRNTVAVLDLRATADGRIDYAPRARLSFPATFTLPVAGHPIWASCREVPGDDLQLEGLVVDERTGTLYAAQEALGVWAIPAIDSLHGENEIPARRLVEPVRSFGAPWIAVPGDDGEYACSTEVPDGPLPDGAVVGAGVANLGGAHLEPDVEGVSIYRGAHERYLVVSSQGVNAYQVYDLGGHGAPLAERFVTSFQVDGVAHTDGVEIDAALGLLVVQNGDAPPPISTAPIHGYKYKASSQLMFVHWDELGL